jgi:hypothetical protein
MEDNKCWYTLDIEVVDAINPKWTWPKLSTWTNIVEDPKKVFTDKWIDQMIEKGLPPRDDCMLFFSPKYMMPVLFSHTDTNPVTSTGAIAGFNFVVGADPADMVWFDLDNLASKKTVLYTESQQPYEIFPVDFNLEIDRRRIGNQLTLVRTDIPHWIGGALPNRRFHTDRWSVSYRTCADNNHWKSWEDCVTQLKPLLSNNSYSGAI